MGGGISGLSLAWFLHPYCEVVVLEKEAHAGGWLKTDITEGFLFDRGPRTFRQNSLFKNLISELEIESEVIYSSKESKKRYLLGKKGLSSISKSALLPALFKEWKVPYYEGEESIAAFANRRFNQEIAETLFDAMALGVYGGNMHELSINACFPKIKEWEKEYGSIAKALLCHLTHLKNHSLFSFKEGSETLCRALVNKLGDRVKLNEAAEKIQFTLEGVEVLTQKGIYSADYLVSAMPSSLLTTYFPRLEQQVSCLKSSSLQMVYCGFDREVLTYKGFGYLVPTRENKSILGAVFDSQIFPEQNSYQGQTRLTMMVKEGCDPEMVAQEALRRDLQIFDRPRLLQIREAKEAIPQYELGHQLAISHLKEAVNSYYPRLYLTGNYLSGVSVADCIKSSKDLSEELLHKFNRSIS